MLLKKNLISSVANCDVGQFLPFLLANLRDFLYFRWEMSQSMIKAVISASDTIFKTSSKGENILNELKSMDTTTLAKKVSVYSKL